MRRITFMTMPVFALICAVFGCFYGLGSYPLFDNNEGMYASIARNMAQGGSLTIPMLNGVPYFEKPPLFYWLTALSFYLFGDSESAARLVPCFSLLCTIGACGVFLKRKANPLAGVITALIMGSSIVLIAIGRTVYFDMLFTCLVSMALLCVYQWYEQNKRLWLVLTYGFTALAVMSKGILGLVLVGGTGFVFLVVERRLKTLWLKTFDPLGILVFLIIVVPWHVRASLADPGFAWFFLVNEQLRFFNMREPHDYYTGPIWYYLPRLLIYLFPWSFCLPLLAVRNPENDTNKRRLERFLWCWFGFVLAFFSLSLAKANYYMIAGMPPLVMLLACRMSALIEAHRTRLLQLLLAAATLGMLMLGIGLYMLCADYVFFQPYCSVVTTKMLILTILLASAGGLVFWRLASPRAGIVVVACSIFLVGPLFVKGVRAGGEDLSQRKVAHYMQKHSPGEPVALYQDFETFSALPYYLGSPSIIINSASKDLLYGEQRYGNDNVHFAALDGWLKSVSESNVTAHIAVNNMYVRDFRKHLQQTPYAARLHMGIKRFTRLSIVTLSTDDSELKSDGE